MVSRLALGSVPAAFVGVLVLKAMGDSADLEDRIKLVLGAALLLAAGGIIAKTAVQRARSRSAPEPVDLRTMPLKPGPTIAVGVLGGVEVGMTSVGSGSIMIVLLLLLYPRLSASQLVGTDLVQAVPLVLAAAISNIVINGLDWSLLIPLVIGSVPGTILGARIAPRVPQSVIRRGIVIVLTMSGVALLDKAGWAPLGAGDDQTHPILIAMIGLALLVLLPLVWGLIRRTQGLPMFGSPTVAELEDPAYRPGIVGMRKADAPAGRGD